MEQDKIALRASQAGMRFIAQMHIYNQAAWGRLRAFIQASYHADLLAHQPTETRLMAFEALHADAGGLRVKQVLAANTYHVIVVMEAQTSGDFYYIETKVEDDYPHKITAWMLTPLQEVAS